MNSAQQAYRSAKLEGVTQLQAHILVLDSVALQLTSAAEAVVKHDIAGRCAATNQAFSMLGHLESWAVLLDDPALHASLSTLYGLVRAQLISAQTSHDPRRFLESADLISGTREAWQKKQLDLTQGKALFAEENIAAVEGAGAQSGRRAWQG